VTTYILGEGASLHAGYPLAGQLRGALYDWISNKKLEHDLYRTRIEIIRDTYRYKLIYQYMENVPIRIINPADPSDEARHSRMVTLVDRILKTNSDIHSGKLGDMRFSI
jgi:hypothetical protein